MTDPIGGPDHAAPTSAETGGAELRALSPRQQQILALLRAGKVNKEIAEELGIGLGTVKQHVVALFKKLNVRNRAMAASRSAPLAPNFPAVAGSHLTAANLLERRPCGVLSLILPEDLPPVAGRLLQQTLAAQAFDHGAVFLARKGHAGDLIFGIQRAGQHDLLRLMRAARLASTALAAHDVELGATLRCGVSAGLAIVSVDRQGSWSGEAIATPAIAEARDLAYAAAPGEIRLGTTAKEVLDALAPHPSHPMPPVLAIAELDRLPWRLRKTSEPMFGRESEWTSLTQQAIAVGQGDSRVVFLEGEVGMGKSLLCRRLAEHVRQNGGFSVIHYLLAPELSGSHIYPMPDGEGQSLETFAIELGSIDEPTLIIVDDAHLLSEAQLRTLVQRAAEAPSRLLVLAARRFAEAASKPDTRIRLGRLPPAEIEQVAMAVAPTLSETHTSAIVRMAAGVPLFAVQLARAAGRPLPLALRLVVSARLDRLALDRLLLHRVARSTIPPTTDDLARLLGEPVQAVAAAADQAIAGGALRCDAEGRLSFTHPLLRLVLAEALVD